MNAAGDDEFCRVCRSEGTAQAPLYHPCKCSGSIRYIHQDCLMEWLRHSQKRHCELCKTPFRFTKLYSDDMPARIPLPVFVARMVARVRRNLLFALRCILVSVLWLIYLPWSTQQAWRYSIALGDAPVSSEALSQQHMQLLEQQQQHGSNATAQPLVRVDGFLPYANITRHASINSFVKHVLEGYIITAVMAVMFIVIFLVREWVMQNAMGILDENMPVDADIVDGNFDDDDDDEASETDEEAQPHLPRVYTEAERELHVAERGNLGDGNRPDRPQQPQERHLEDIATQVNAGEADETRLWFDQMRRNREAMGAEPDAHHIQDLLDQAVEERLNEIERGRAQIAAVRRMVEEQADRRQRMLELEQQQQRNAAAAVAAANNNAALNDFDEAGDELDGLFELVGLRGPMISLYQNILLINILTWAVLFFFLTIPGVIGRFALAFLFRSPVTFFTAPVKLLATGLGRLFLRPVIEVAKLPMMAAALFSPGIMRHVQSLVFSLSDKISYIGRLGSDYAIGVSLAGQRYFTEWVHEFAKQRDWDLSHAKAFVGHLAASHMDRTFHDRIFALVAGYASCILILLVYMKNSPLFSANTSQPRLYEAENLFRETAKQFGTIVKFVFILSIELVLFPFFCGLLLLGSLVDIFGTTGSAQGAWDFMAVYPVTSFFLLWFVGTVYMFHFAMFVSMCREIVRPGVLFFIRDPNDPQNHPVKEILDRPVATQMRKIGISAIFYTVLIVGCIGFAVKFVKFAMPGVLPLQFYTRFPIFEIPIDMIVFQLVVPFLKKAFRPSAMLKRLAAAIMSRMSEKLRLSSFILGGRYRMEEGRHVRRTWRAILLRTKGDILAPVEPGEEPPDDVEVYFVRDGSFLKAPSYDSLPTRKRMLHPVTEAGEPLDEYGRKHIANDPNYTVVYVPPAFRLRVVLYLFLVWVFSVLTGYVILIGPLLLGRLLFRTFVSSMPMHDLYSFTMGCLFIGVFARTFQYIKEQGSLISHGTRVAPLVWPSCVCLFKWLVMSVVFLFALPLMIGLVWESYVLIPFMLVVQQDSRPVVHVPHDWAFGFFVMKISCQLLLAGPDSEYARLIRNVVQDGWYEPKIGRVIIRVGLPALSVLLLLLITPSVAMWAIMNMIPRVFNLFAHAIRIILVHGGALPAASETMDMRPFVYILAYPAFAVVLLQVANVILAKWALDKCREAIQDEVYLVGEQLHNHGEDAPERALVHLPPEIM